MWKENIAILQRLQLHLLDRLTDDCRGLSPLDTKNRVSGVHMLESVFKQTWQDMVEEYEVVVTVLRQEFSH